MVANQGQVVQLLPGGGRNIISQIVDIPGVQYGKLNDWNQVEIIARGNTVVHILNGHVFCIGIDDDPVRRAAQGMLSLQLEASGTVAYRNIWLKKFDPAADPIPAALRVTWAVVHTASIVTRLPCGTCTSVVALPPMAGWARAGRAARAAAEARKPRRFMDGLPGIALRRGL